MPTVNSLELNYTPKELIQILQHSAAQRIQERGRKVQSTPEMLDRLEKIGEWLTNPTRPGLLLYGTLGSGKTTIANAICDIIRIVKHGTVYRQNSMGLIDILQSKTGNTDALRGYMTASFLLLDDLGTEPLAVKEFGNERLPIIEILEYRYIHQLPTIITTNLDDESLTEKYGERILDRLNEMCARFGFSAKSFR